MTAGPAPGRTAEDIAESAEAVRETFSCPLGAGGVAVVDGRGCMVNVERGRLHIADGLGPHRRERTWDKATHDLRRVVVVGADAMISTAALRWCAGTGVSLVVLGPDGAVLSGGPPGRSTARLLRAQAVALYGATGVEVAGYVIGCKLRGEAKVLRRLGEHDAAGTLDEMAEAVGNVDSIEQVRAIEAGGANVYWGAWERAAEVVFTRKDLPRVPEAWRRFNGRRSAINPGSPRSATDVAGALLNYEYKLTEVESTIALSRIGLSETLGVLHADMPNRPSFSCDVQEAVRPLADEHVLDICRGPLLKRTFVEDSRGVVRVLSPMSHRLAEAMGAFGEALGPVVERVAAILAKSSPYDLKVPTVLSGAKHRAAARRRVTAERASGAAGAPAPVGPNPGGIAPRGRPRRKPATLPVPEPLCHGCGAKLPVEADRDRSRRGWCDACLPERRGEVGSVMQAASRTAAQTFAELTGALPSHTPEATAARRAANARQVAVQRAWEETTTGELDEHWYIEQIAPALAAFTLPAIARATGVSTSAASKWRAGRTTPHRRHWAALAELAGVKVPVDPPSAEVATFEKAADLREQCADDAMHEEAAALAREEAEPASEPLAAVVAVVR